MQKKIDLILVILLILAAAGVIDSAYLTYKHYAVDASVTCGFGIFAECGRVLKSSYSQIIGVPLALLGFLYYCSLFIVLVALTFREIKLAKFTVLLLTFAGLFTSVYLVYIQVLILNALCLYCIISAVLSITLFALAQKKFAIERIELISRLIRFLYIHFIKHLMFLFPSDNIHERAVDFGGFLGRSELINKVFDIFFNYKNPVLRQKITGVQFENPIGLAAGFDYDAKLTQIMPSLGFGFHTVGTVTNLPYEGNTPPRLGRLPKSKSLMVNKGFKNSGVKVVIEKLKMKNFRNSLGISIGRTNSLSLATQKLSVEDIVTSFKSFERSKVKNSYYELNISCPNLKGDVTFYPPKNLEELLSAVDKLKIKKPIFVKMPIEKSDREVLDMLKVISRHNITGVIFGNLQKDRKDRSFVKSELKKYKVGNFSGKPTFVRSNELITLCYKKYKTRFVIIGCGGIFDGRDAYEKICRGASLVQLVTALVYQGPQVAANVNIELAELLKKDGYKNISDAVGTIKS